MLELTFLGVLAGGLITWAVAVWALARVPRVGEMVPVSGGALHVFDIGPRDAQAVVMVHGLYGQIQHFTYALTTMLGEDLRLVIVDRPGCGYSTRHRFPLDPRQQALRIQEALDHIGVTNPVLVGHSLGGAVAMEMALARPRTHRGMVLLAPALLPLNNVPGRLPKATLALIWPLLPLVTATLAVPGAFVLRPLIRGRVFAPEPVYPNYGKRGGASLGLRPKNLQTAAEDALTLGATAHDRALDIARADIPPGIVVFGARDRIVPPAPQIQALEAKGWTSDLLPEAGHMIPLTAAEACARHIHDMATRF